MVETEFDCPECGRHFEEEEWYGKYQRSKTGIFRVSCPECGMKLEGTTDLLGDVKVWAAERQGKPKERGG